MCLSIPSICLSTPGGVPEPGPGGAGYPSQVQAGRVPRWGYPTLGTHLPIRPGQGGTLSGGALLEVPHLRYPPSDLVKGYPLAGYPTFGNPPSDLARGYPARGIPPWVCPIGPGWGVPHWGVPHLGYPLSDLAGGTQPGGYPTSGTPPIRPGRGYPARGTPPQVPPSQTWPEGRVPHFS